MPQSSASLTEQLVAHGLLAALFTKPSEFNGSLTGCGLRPDSRPQEKCHATRRLSRQSPPTPGSPSQSLYLEANAVWPGPCDSPRLAWPLRPLWQATPPGRQISADRSVFKHSRSRSTRDSAANSIALCAMFRSLPRVTCTRPRNRELPHSKNRQRHDGSVHAKADQAFGSLTRNTGIYLAKHHRRATAALELFLTTMALELKQPLQRQVVDNQCLLAAKTAKRGTQGLWTAGTHQPIDFTLEKATKKTRGLRNRPSHKTIKSSCSDSAPVLFLHHRLPFS